MESANQKWIDRMAKENPTYFDMNKAGHFPKMLWIGCVDARVPANELINEPAGSIFVHRNVANQAINTDMSVMSILHFAVDYHKVKHIVVCGHHDCGGVKAAMTPADHGSPLENWVRNVRDVYRLHATELNAISDLTERQRRLTELNVIESCRNLFKTIHVQRARKESAKTQPFAQPQIHACTFEPTTGLLKRLPLNLEQLEAEMKGIYGLV
jgi:carbonic anhydrase